MLGRKFFRSLERKKETLSSVNDNARIIFKMNFYISDFQIVNDKYRKDDRIIYLGIIINGRRGIVPAYTFSP